MSFIKNFIVDIKRLSIGHKPRSDILDDLYGIYAIIRVRLRHLEIGKNKVIRVVRVEMPVCNYSDKDKIYTKGTASPTVVEPWKN